LLLLRPLGGTNNEIAGVDLNLEVVEDAKFSLPEAKEVGDHRSSRMLRDALRLGFRSSAGPFRSLASVGVEPRPYQLVPLLMALRLNPVRLLIADDVGIGKTVEAALIAKELLARGEIERLCVLCPPHLAEQWQVELRDKFGIEAELVLSSTANRLEKKCRLDESVFQRYPVTIVSLDFIKTERRRNDFLRTCPEFVIVDEAHTCTQGGQGAQQRFQLLKDLSLDESRHIVLVTATPHSGNEQSFRSLLSILNQKFNDLPEDFSEKKSEVFRRELAAHFVQRRRGDIKSYLQEETPFPEREEADQTYKLSPDYRRFFDKVLKYARESVLDNSGTRFQQRIRWWSALALLRCLASSPAAAVATLRARASTAAAETEEDVNEIGRRSVLDNPDSDDRSEIYDLAPGSDPENISSNPSHRRRLLDMASEAQCLLGSKDEKLHKLIPLLRKLLEDGFKPIVFCRYIETAEYVANELRRKLSRVEIACVTGILPPAEREQRVLALSEFDQRILVCTDCLSEGINLQQHFDAVTHYDLSWSPTRHEQREGRVDRFNQRSQIVRTITYYGEDNPVDGIVLRVLLDKHRRIRTRLGVSVAVPIDHDKVAEAILEALILKESHTGHPQQLSFDDLLELPEKKQLDIEWDKAEAREKRSRTIFAQETIKVEEVGSELNQLRSALGSGYDLRRFLIDSVRAVNGTVNANGVLKIDLDEADQSVKDAVGWRKPFVAKLTLPVTDHTIHLSRTHPFVEGLATYILESALDGNSLAPASRCGAIRTNSVSKRTHLLLLRNRYHLVSSVGQLLAEDCQLLAFEGAPEQAQWLSTDEAEALLDAVPGSNISPDQARDFLRVVLEKFDEIRGVVVESARKKGEDILQSHSRVRRAIRGASFAQSIELQGEPDVLGIYILLPEVKF
jgi:superfamily II DNA or RNA helicase